jgi:hypothetical protein
MRSTIFTGAILSLTLVTLVTLAQAQASADNGAAANAATAKLAKATVKAALPVQSGVYGYSGAKMGDSGPLGVVGECIWIYDSDNKQQIAKGECQKSDAGNFRVALAPGRYVVHGPGGNQKVEIKPGGWIKVSSIIKIPAMF